MLKPIRWVTIAALAGSSFGLFAYCATPDLDQKLRRDLDALASGRSLAETQLIGGADWVCIDRSAFRREFLAESVRLGGAFTRSLERCGVDNSCCIDRSDLGGVVGLVKDGEIRCVETESYDLYVRPEQAFCVKPDRLAVSRKVAVDGEHVLGRPWVGRASRTSFDVGSKVDDRQR
ncbi:hypothetical protein [Bradyrhizobium sp. USDA 4353]